MGICIENTKVDNITRAVYSARNAMNSWDRSDSDLNTNILGENDYKLAYKLCRAGSDHRKFMRMITVMVDITAPLYFWKEFDTYKIGSVANSCSTMHKIHEKEFTLEDFSSEHLVYTYVLEQVIKCLNWWRNAYIITDDIERRDYMLTRFNPSYVSPDLSRKEIWWQMIQLLPSSYNQKRTVMLNYEVLANIYKSRKNHKLDEWARHSCCTKDPKEWGKPVYLGFCDWIETLPYSELITGLTEIDKVEEMGKCVSEGFREGLMEVVQQNGLLNTYTGEIYLPKEEKDD